MNKKIKFDFQTQLRFKTLRTRDHGPVAQRSAKFNSMLVNLTDG